MTPINFSKQWRKRQSHELRLIQVRIEREKREKEQQRVTRREPTSALENLQIKL